MNSDSHYEIGSSHKVCQDYAIHGNHNSAHYVIISDGCSSSKDVDIGARILCHTTKTAIEETMDMACSNGDWHQLVIEPLTEFIKEYVLRKSRETITNLNLHIESLDATLILAIKDNDKTYLICWGDGGYILTKKNGVIEYSTIDYESGAPYYLSYELNSGRAEEYKRIFGNKNKVLTSWTEQGITQNKIPLLDPFIREIDNSDYSSISIVSDGIMSYQYEPNNLENINQKTLGKYSLDSIVSRLVSYKNIQGEFVLRRMNKIKSEIKKERIEHYDDMACGTIIF